MSKEIKQALRLKYLKDLKNIDQEKRKQWDASIYQQFIASEYFIKSQTIALYFSLPYEVDTIALINALLKANKKVALPRIKDQDLQFYYISNLLDLVLDNQWNIYQPKVNSQVADIGDFDLVIVPLVAFNQKHFRIGHGRGYYDRYLSHPNCRAFKLALAYKMQEVASDVAFFDSWDVTFDAIITNK